MTSFQDILEEYKEIKKSPEILDNLRTTENSANGRAADNPDERQNYLPDAKTHAKLQANMTTMFDKTSRAGAKSSLHGLILPNGRKMFKEFHDNYTGTGRYKPQVAPDKVILRENAPKVDTRKPSVVLYERCLDCLDRVDRDHAVPNLTFIPPGDKLNPIARAKWESVQIKPGMILAYLFCDKCPAEAAKEVKKILHDPIKSRLQFPTPDGKMMSLAEKEAHAYMSARGQRIEDNVFQQISYHRGIPDTDIFYYDAKI